MIDEKHKFVRFTEDGFDHTTFGEEVPYFVSFRMRVLDFIFGHKWIKTTYHAFRENEIRCDRCWKLKI